VLSWNVLFRGTGMIYPYRTNATREKRETEIIFEGTASKKQDENQSVFRSRRADNNNKERGTRDYVLPAEAP
jgi:hypothetical protein